MLENDLPLGMTKEDVNAMHKEWQEEKDRLLVKLSNTNVSTKFIYERMTQLLKFSEMLPKLFLKATTAEKKLIVTTLTKSVKFDGENVIVELKDTFKALQNVKKDYAKSIVNTNHRPPANSSIITKNGSKQAKILNGAEYRTKFEFLDKKIKPLFETVDVITLVEAIKLFLKPLYA